MNLKKLFEMQKVLDDRIVKEKGLEGVDLLPMKILALQTELGECANEWRGFKFWSEDQKARVEVPVTAWGPPYKNPLLEEYVDCLHFILSIGLELDVEHVYGLPKKAYSGIVRQFIVLNKHISSLLMQVEADKEAAISKFILIIQLFIGLGEMLGFTQDQVVKAYMDKNKVNHERQANGY